MSEPVRLIVVGGFLGAGKTTLLWAAAERLMARGLKVGLITNDQAPELVDTALLRGRGADVREVAGSCFCCNFPAFLDAARDLKGAVAADVLLAEPVGSCTDLSATILQPIKDRYAADFRLCPFSVLADPERLQDILAGRGSPLHSSACYIFRKQLEEADTIVLNKADTLDGAARRRLADLLETLYPGTDVRAVSARSGEGVDAWLDAALAGEPGGRKIAEVDYDVYAEGEAVLGWLNAEVALTARSASPQWRQFVQSLLERLATDLAARRAEIGHVKLLLVTPGGAIAGNLTRTGSEPDLRGGVGGTPVSAELILNARAQVAPEELEDAARRAIAGAAGDALTADYRYIRSLRPGRPRPTYRYAPARNPASG